MSDMSKWDHKDEWHQHGKDFLVVVKRYAVSPSSFGRHEGLHRWAVYAYVYPKHRLFGNFCGPSMWQPAAAALPLHGGPSLLRWPYHEDLKPTSVQLGADYYPLSATHFNSYHTADDSCEVFDDAERLFDHLAESGEALAVGDLASLIANGRKAWADVPDANQWVEEQRCLTT